jgi:DNA mismatch endonuclease, patch repair protein
MRDRHLTRPSPARSAQMSLVKGRGNKSTELLLASIMRRGKIVGWRRNQQVFGRPDFVFRKQQLAVFVDGCFWHGCKRCGRRPPQANAVFWSHKIQNNIARDRKVGHHLRSKGWKVVRFWEHELGDKNAVLGKLRRSAGPAGRPFGGRGK